MTAPITNAQRNKRAILAIIGSVLVVAATLGGIRIFGGGQAAASSGGGSGGGGSSSSSASAGRIDWCYVTLNGAEVTEYMAIDMDPGQSCSEMALALQQVFLGASVGGDGPNKPFGANWSAACMGTLTADDDPATVIAYNGDDTGDVCSTLGFSSVP
jgi:hypothetical protein